jgi:Amidohydrolase family
MQCPCVLLVQLRSGTDSSQILGVLSGGGWWTDTGTDTNPKGNAPDRSRVLRHVLTAKMAVCKAAHCGSARCRAHDAKRSPPMSVESSATVFRGVRVFDGRHSALQGPSDVVVRGTTIESMGPAGEPVPAGPDVRVIDGGGRVLMPGLIDAHWHTTFVAVSAGVALTADPGYLHLMAGREAQRTLLRGFTSVRDAGGPSFALKRAIDEGVIAGPRIYPSGAFITPPAGHGDFRMRHEVPRACGTLSHGESPAPPPSPTGSTRCCGRPASSCCWGRASSR